MQRNRKLTQTEFIEKARAVHGDKYDYSQAVYTGLQENVTIICDRPDHPPFPQTPANHIYGKKGCNDCGKKRSADAKRKSREQFIEDARQVHGDRYDYSQVEYIRTGTKVKILCPVHGPFCQRPSDHLKGKRCKECAPVGSAHGWTDEQKDSASERYRMPLPEFLNRAKAMHGDRYDYSKVKDLRNTHQKITIICRKHNEQREQHAGSHLQGHHPCSQCAREEKSRRQDEFMAARVEAANFNLHEGVFDISKIYRTGDVRGSRRRFLARCSKHGITSDREIYYFIRGMAPCRKCKSEKISKALGWTTSDFIEAAKRKHGDRYEYNLVEYQDAKTPVTIVCKRHGTFPQQPYIHTIGCGCPTCAHEDYGGYLGRDTFPPDKPYRIYFLLFTHEDGETFYKVGLTKTIIRGRFEALNSAYTFEVLRSGCCAFAEAWDTEERIKDYAAHYALKHWPQHRFHRNNKPFGCTECMEIDSQIMEYASSQFEMLKRLDPSLLED